MWYMGKFADFLHKTVATLSGVPTVQFSDSWDTNPKPIDLAVLQGGNGWLPTTVNRHVALGVPAISRGRNLLCGLATLPLTQYGPDRKKIRNPFFDQIDPNVPNLVTLAQTIEDLLFDAESWWFITEFGANGYPYSAIHLDPYTVSVTPQNAGHHYSPLPSGVDPRDAVLYVDGKPVPGSQLIRFESPNQPLLRSAARTIRRAILLDQTSEMYADNPRALGYFTPQDDNDPAGDDDIRDLLSDWRAARKEGADAYVPAKLKYNALDTISPADIQLKLLQDQCTIQLAAFMGLDPEDFGISTTSRTYQNAVDRRKDRINDVLAPYMDAITCRLSMGDVTPRGHRVEFDLDDYLRADPKTRWEVYQIAEAMGAMSVEEIRAEEDLPPLPRPLPVRAPVIQGQPGNNVVPIGRKQQAAGFEGDEATLTFEGNTVGFDVQAESRIIEGIVVPYNRVAMKNGKKYRFLPGSLKATDINRVKLLLDHDFSQPVAKLIFAEERPEGLFARFKVGSGAEGDKALANAAEGVRDGFSVGVDITDAAPDPFNRGVQLVTAAQWRETSLLAMPAYDDARVTRVLAGRDEGVTMNPCATCGHVHQDGQQYDHAFAPQQVPAQPAQFDMNAAFAAFMAQHQQPAPQPQPIQFINQPVQPAPVEPRQIVDPRRRSELQAVNEQPLYRFDGRRGQRCFTADIANGFDGDSTLRNQAEEFIAEQMRLVFTNIGTSGVGTLNPTIQRPDLWVPNLYFATRPIGSTVRGGVVDEITTQRLPKFSASAGLLATHVEGTEPTDGSFSTTSQDVTPAAMSGRVTINREVIDQGGSPQADQLIWNEMLEFYAKLLEQRLVDALQALSLSDTPIVGVNGDLQQALLTEFAGLQFIAGGDRYTGLALAKDMYTAIVGAVDDTGRSLFPMLNPTNAVGGTATDFTSVRVGSKVGSPAWALETANGGPAKSFLYVPGSVYQWFSPPRRFDLNQVYVSTVGIGIWGYSAEFISRNADVIQLAYTAS
jgi:HK97 family phage prohead protease